MTEIAIALAVWLYLAGVFTLLTYRIGDEAPAPNNVELALWPFMATFAAAMVARLLVKEWRYRRARRKAKP